jgi:hypothetical protein
MFGRLGALSLFFVLVALPAHAERLIRPGYVIREVTSRAANGNDNRLLVREEALASLPRGIARSPMKRNGAFKKALGTLVVTRDLDRAAWGSRSVVGSDRGGERIGWRQCRLR